MGAPQWPDERVETLLDHAAQGLSASLIAARMGGGLTRDAVIGKLDRLRRKRLGLPAAARTEYRRIRKKKTMSRQPLPGQIRHKASLRRADAVNVTVFANDGRHPETYTFDIAEIRRFAWAILADYAPDAAREAAQDSGVDLDVAAAIGRLRPAQIRAVSRKPDPPEPGSDMHLILAEIARLRVARIAQLKHLPIKRPSGPRGVVASCTERGWVCRADEGRQGCAADWAITSAGEDALREMEAAQAPAQAA